MRILFMCLFLIGISCQEKKRNYDLPIPRAQLKSLLIDLYIAGAASEVNPSSNKDSLKRVYHTEICKSYKITTQQLTDIVDGLHSNPTINAEIQKEILDTMNAMQSPGFKFKPRTQNTTIKK